MTSKLVSMLVATALLATSTTAQKACSVSNNPSYFTHVATLDAPGSTQDPLYLAGLFDVFEKGSSAYECGLKTRESGIQHMMAFFWAINRYRNNRGDNPKAGGVVFDTCGRPEQAVSNMLGFEQCNLRVSGVDRRQVMAFIGPETSEQAMAVGKLTPGLALTAVSPSATSSMLSDAVMYPYFLRTTPTDLVEVDIIADIFDNKQFKYLMVVYQEDEFGRMGMEKLRQRFPGQRYGQDKCISYSAALPVTPTAAQVLTVVNELLARYQTRYVALLLNAQNTRLVLDTVASISASAQKLRFIGTSMWGNNASLTAGRDSHVTHSLVIERSVPDSYESSVSDFVTYWRSLKPANQVSWFQQFWQDKFSCQLSNVPSPCNVSIQSLSNSAMDKYVPYTIMAVDVVLQGIEAAARGSCRGSFMLCTELMNANNRGPLIFDRIRNVTYSSVNIFDQNGDLSRGFSHHKIYRIGPNNNYIEVGYYKAGAVTWTQPLDSVIYPMTSCTTPSLAGVCTECGEQVTTTPPTTVPVVSSTMASTTPNPLSSGNVTMVAFPPGQHITGAYSSVIRRNTEFGTRFDLGHMWIIALGVLAGLGILAVIVFEIYILMKLLGSNFIHKWRTMWLGQLLLFGLLCCYLTLIAFLFIPTKATCGITRFGVGVSYSICFSVLLVKLMVILTSKSSESLLPGDVESPNYLKGIYQFLMFVFATGVQVVIAIQWLITVPPEAVKVLDNRGQAVWICNHYTWDASSGMGNMTTFVRTEFENHVLSLVYIMFLMLITTLLALNAHGIITNHRESVFIGISAGFSIPIWLAWTLVGGLNKDHAYAQEFGDATIAFGLFMTATLILFAMFLPKVRQLVNMGVEGIYFEDDRDTYAGSVIMAPPSYKSRPNSVIYVNNNGIYSDPIVLGSGEPSPNHLRHPGSTYSAPPVYLKKTPTGSLRGAKTLMITGDLTGKRPVSKSEINYGTPRRPVSEKGTLRRARSQQDLGSL